MDQQSHIKVIKAGFGIIRKDDHPVPRIKIKDESSEWRTLEDFKTKAARNRRFNELMQLQTIIND